MVKSSVALSRLIFLSKDGGGDGGDGGGGGGDDGGVVVGGGGAAAGAMSMNAIIMIRSRRA